MSVQLSTYQALLTLDTNKDRRVSLDELQKIDSNKDGQLSFKEAQNAGFVEQDRALIAQRLQGQIPKGSMIAFDSQELNAMKMVAPLNTYFESIDRNGNGRLSKSELGQVLGRQQYNAEASASITMAYKNYTEMSTVHEDSNWLPHLPQNKYLDKLPLHAYDERGISRKDLSDFVALGVKRDAKVSEAMGRYSMASYGGGSIKQELFPKGLESIRPDHIEQGELGDCYFLAAVASLAHTPQGKQQIFNMIQSLPDQRYQVTFPGKEPIVIDAPTTGEMSMYGNSGQDGLWLSVLEKAYAQQTNQDAWLKKGNPYEKIGSGALLKTGVSAVTGKSTQTDILVVTPMDTLRLKLEIALPLQKVVTAGINNNPFGDGRTGNGLPVGHAYSILGYDRSSDTITVRNPWGSTEVLNEQGQTRDGRNDGTFEMPLEEFSKTFHMVTFSNN